MKRILLFALLASRLVAQPVITSQPANQTVVWGSNATFSVMATGVGPLTYQWQMNGTNLPNNIISTVAGGNLFNNQPATNTILGSPTAVVADAAGNLFIADHGANVVRKVSTNGLTTIIAGTGSGSFSGDGGAATNAGLWGPYGLVFDKMGNLFISDNGNNRIRKVGTNGVISTYAGNGSTFPFAGDGGAATNASLNYPTGIAVDTNGNLFIADSQNVRIRKVATNGIITTIAGNGSSSYGGDGSLATSASINFPIGVAVDISNNLFIADSGNSRIRKVNAGGIISTVAGNGTPGYSGDGGSPTSAKLNGPDGVFVLANGTLFITDTGNHCVRKVDTNNIIVTLAGNGAMGFSGDGGVATNANLVFPNSSAADSAGNLFIADTSNNRVRKVVTNGIISTVAGRALNDGDAATNATFNISMGVAADTRGNLYVVDSSNQRIRKVDTNGIITTFAGNGLPTFSGDGGQATNAGLRSQSAVCFDGLGNLFIADFGSNRRIRKVDTNGVISTVAGKGFAPFSGDGGPATNAGISAVYALVADASGNLLFADSGNSRIRRVGTNGIITTIAGTGGFGFSGDGGAATNASLSSPLGLALGPGGNLFIVDVFNNRVRKVDAGGIITTVAGNGVSAFSGDGGPATNASISPWSVTIDEAGNLFIFDPYGRIRKVNTNGIINTIAGNGTLGYSGDGGPAINASLCGQRGLAMDASGNLLVADDGNNRIRKIAYLEYADQRAFSVTSVTTNCLGNTYSVIVTGSSGSVTSGVASVVLQLPPITPSFTVSNGTIAFTWSAVSNLTYQLQYTTNLTAPVWQNLGDPITATNSSISTGDVPPDNQRFYRVQLVQ